MQIWLQRFCKATEHPSALELTGALLQSYNAQARSLEQQPLLRAQSVFDASWVVRARLRQACLLMDITCIGLPGWLYQTGIAVLLDHDSVQAALRVWIQPVDQHQGCESGGPSGSSQVQVGCSKHAKTECRCWCSKDLCSIVDLCLAREPESRPSAQQLLAIPAVQLRSRKLQLQRDILEALPQAARASLGKQPSGQRGPRASQLHATGALRRTSSSDAPAVDTGVAGGKGGMRRGAKPGECHKSASATAVAPNPDGVPAARDSAAGVLVAAVDVPVSRDSATGVRATAVGNLEGSAGPGGALSTRFWCCSAM